MSLDSEPQTDPLWRGMICLSLAIGFDEDRARHVVGVPQMGCAFREREAGADDE